MLVESYSYHKKKNKKADNTFNIVIVPKGTLPQDLDYFQNKKLTFILHDTFDLTPKDKRPSLDCTQAIDDIRKKGFHLGSAGIEIWLK